MAKDETVQKTIECLEELLQRHKEDAARIEALLKELRGEEAADSEDDHLENAEVETVCEYPWSEIFSGLFNVGHDEVDANYKVSMPHFYSLIQRLHEYQKNGGRMPQSGDSIEEVMDLLLEKAPEESYEEMLKVSALMVAILRAYGMKFQNPANKVTEAEKMRNNFLRQVSKQYKRKIVLYKSETLVDFDWKAVVERKISIPWGYPVALEEYEEYKRTLWENYGMSKLPKSGMPLNFVVETFINTQSGISEHRFMGIFIAVAIKMGFVLGNTPRGVEEEGSSTVASVQELLNVYLPVVELV